MVSSTATGAVVEVYIRASIATMVIAGSKETTNWPITWRLGSDGSLKAPNKPVSALPLRELKAFDSGGSGTSLALSASGGARCGLNLASTMT